MKRFLLLILVLAIAGMPATLLSQEEFIRVTAPGNKPLTLMVAPPVPLDSAPQDAIAREVTELFQFDLTLAGSFTVTTPIVTENRGIRPGEFSFAPWQNAGATLLIKSGYTVNGSTLILEFRLYDVIRERELLAKRYSGNIKELRRMAHTFSDDLLLIVTGERGPFTGKVAFVSKASGNKELYLMDYDGFNLQRLTNNGSINLNPDFSPNGRELIYTSYKKGNPDLYRRELFTGAEARTSSSRGINVTGSWSPDGKRIALALSKDGNSEIYLINRDGKQPTRLTNNPAIDVSPAWSPDGRQIAFVSDRLGKPQVFVMNADGSSVRRLTTEGAYNVSPRWSPKGDRIVYCRQQGDFQIHSINTDGSGDVQLTSQGSNEHPRWSPDGRFIVFSSTRDGRESIYVMRADGSGQTRVSRGKANDSHPTWSVRW
ncbi:Tol-Pal system beta propeller repeat protein TolB [Geobacter argillaceus]|uniref:TolB protein n=1 Tax=Geobacter argillaceus TaxID=345631 RepID=A0A562VNZ0_9BACT|nr:Tol-Pal system beta propeller repeat protein TolB [Geobacter argillaceus]TWJ19501.1 TolB protein [Geobacter argillaceus]